METKQKFYFHPVGLDRDGNGEPDKTEPGWMIVEATNVNEAIKLLPESHSKTTQSFWKRYEKDMDTTYEDFSKILEETCGWGNGFSLLSELDWDHKEY
jgi:hypothetical protein